MLRDASELGLDWLFARCAEVDGCLVWKLAAAHGTDPQARIGGRGGACILVRRVLWELVNERPFPRKHNAGCNCGTALCVHPDHLLAIPKRAYNRGRPLPLLQRAAIAASKRANSDLSEDDVRRIRASTGRLQDTAEEFAIDPTYVSLIRLGKVRRDYSSPYLQLEGA